MPLLLTVMMGGLPVGSVDAPLEFVQGYVSVRVAVNGTPCRLMVDTGAPFSTLEMVFARTAGLRPERCAIPVLREEWLTRACTASVSVGVAAYRGGLVCDEEYSPVLRRINKAFEAEKLPTFQGILGNDFLIGSGTQIDLAGKTLRLRAVSRFGRSGLEEEKK